MQHSEFPWQADRPATDPVGVVIVSDVRLDPDAPILSFYLGGVAQSYWIDEASVIALRGAAEQRAPIVELNLDGGDGCHAIWLAPRDLREPGHWGGARMIHLGSPAAPDMGAAFQAFVTQMSGALAELQHDMRQPLAAIALAAHNGEALLLMGRPEQALGKFDHIRRHVLRCEERIQNGVAWLSSDVPGAAVVVRFASAVHAALTPARQWMAEANVALVVSGDLPAGAVRALPGSLEMLLGFVLRQAAEAVSRGPAPKIVEVMLDEDSSTLRVTVRHSGTPDDGEAACDGIALAMAQRLVGQTCGEVVVPGPAACRTGMAATLFFLRCDGDATRSPDQFAFASSLR